MKKSILYIITTFLYLNSFGQIESKQQKIWFWEITSIGGARIDPEIEPNPKPNIHHHAYIETKTKRKIENITFWLRSGTVYSASLKYAAILPIKMQEDILVPKTLNSEYECSLTTIETLLLPNKIKNLLKNNELVVSYSIKNIKYYTAVKSIKKKTQNLP